MEVEKSDPFASLDAKDGYHVVRVEFGGLVTITCLAYAGGEPLTDEAAEPTANKPSVELFDVYQPSPAEAGASVRLHRVTEAVARYFTTGGSWRELDNALKAMETVIPGGLVFPGYHLCDSYTTTDGEDQHVFVKDGTTDAVLWEQPTPNAAGGLVGGFVDHTTLEKLKEQQENDESVWGPRRTEAGAAEEAGPPDLLQLPPGRGDGGEETPA